MHGATQGRVGEWVGGYYRKHYGRIVLHDLCSVGMQLLLPVYNYLLILCHRMVTRMCRQDEGGEVEEGNHRLLFRELWTESLIESEIDFVK